MLRIAFHSSEYFRIPFRLPIGEIAHSGHQPYVRLGRVDDTQLSHHILRYGEVVRNMEAAAVVTGIAVAAPDGAAYHYVHILYQGFYTDSHLLRVPF